MYYIQLWWYEGKGWSLSSESVPPDTAILTSWGCSKCARSWFSCSRTSAYSFWVYETWEDAIRSWANNVLRRRYDGVLFVTSFAARYSAYNPIEHGTEQETSETLKHVIVKSTIDSLGSRYNSEVHRNQWGFHREWNKSARASQGYKTWTQSNHYNTVQNINCL